LLAVFIIQKYRGLELKQAKAKRVAASYTASWGPVLKKHPGLVT
jgi:hypothetical protein